MQKKCELNEIKGRYVSYPDSEALIKTSARQFPVLLVTGPRQGKLGLLRQLSRKDRAYVTLDSPGPAIGPGRPALFRHGFPRRFLVDDTVCPRFCLI